MTKNKATIAAAIGALISLGAVQASFAADDTSTEKCYGVAKAGKNDCAAGKHACAGQSTADRAPSEWIKLPKGTCERLVGGNLKPAKK